MAISVNKEKIVEAFDYIDQNGVPDRNQSTKYELICENGKKYPPKYVVAVARFLEKGTTIETEDFNAIEAKNLLEKMGFNIETKEQEKYELTISADSVFSSDERFTMDDLGLGDGYKPLGAVFRSADGTEIQRKYLKGERRNTNMTMPRIAFQIYEKQIASLSVEEKEQFPVCQYKPSQPMICGIFTNVDDFKKYRNTIEYLQYSYDNGRMFIIYCWNIFSTIHFVQECLKRFGQPGDQFILTYREKDEKDEEIDKEDSVQEELVQQFKGYRNPYSSMLVESKNLIFRGAPGTGKSYLAKEIATDIISNGYFEDYRLLSEEQKKQIEFVQFHPSYDYSDFVEGLRPKLNEDGTMGFELQDGIFKKFVARARKNYEDAKKSKETIEKELSVQDAFTDFFSTYVGSDKTLKTSNDNEFSITNVDDNHVYIYIPKNSITSRLTLNLDDIKQMLEADQSFNKVKDVTSFFGKTHNLQVYSYYLAMYKEIQSKVKKNSSKNTKTEDLKKYVFIIDEINRGEISKIFGELFYSIDPGYRGPAGEISTQYSNLHSNSEKFYIPENVYIIGTMNDIDRSVDSFDFAMRRRFRFVELKADDRLDMLECLKPELEAEAIKRMSALNKEIAAVPDLNENYQIGASYFLKLKSLDFDQLWTDFLQPLLQEYIHGMYDEQKIMSRFAQAYGYKEPDSGDVSESIEG